MNRINIPIKDVLLKSTMRDMSAWFEKFPYDAAWYVISDYCVGDENKNNDAISFSILLNHDEPQNIAEYIKAWAPKDLKSTSKISVEFLKYVNCPVIFHITFILDKREKLLRDHLNIGFLEKFFLEMEGVVGVFEKNSPENKYWGEVVKRIFSYKREINSGRMNPKLARQIIITGITAGLVFYLLTITKKPLYIKWISDRDAIIDRHNGIVYDLAYLIFLLEYSSVLPKNKNLNLIDRPKFIYPIPEKAGENYFDEFVRIPDYLAGTMADIDLSNEKFSHDKFTKIFSYSLKNSPNISLVRIYSSPEIISAERIAY